MFVSLPGNNPLFGLFWKLFDFRLMGVRYSWAWYCNVVSISCLSEVWYLWFLTLSSLLLCPLSVCFTILTRRSYLCSIFSCFLGIWLAPPTDTPPPMQWKLILQNSGALSLTTHMLTWTCLIQSILNILMCRLFIIISLLCCQRNGIHMFVSLLLWSRGVVVGLWWGSTCY